MSHISNEKKNLNRLAGEFFAAGKLLKREAARDIGQYMVRASLPVNVLGVYVLLPDPLWCADVVSTYTM